MQFAKDSFLLALQQRLAGLNPARTVTINGATVPAVVAVENLPPSAAEPQPNAFYIEWGLEQIAETNTEGRIRMEVELGELRDGQDEIKRLINAHDRNLVEATHKNKP